MPAEPKFAQTPSPAESDGPDHNTIQAGEDDLLAFPSMRVFHDLRISMADWSLLAELTGILKEHGANVERLSLQSQQSGCVVLCRIEGVRPRVAIAAVAKVRRLEGTVSASVEHLLLRR